MGYGMNGHDGWRPEPDGHDDNPESNETFEDIELITDEELEEVARAAEDDDEERPRRLPPVDDAPEPEPLRLFPVWEYTASPVGASSGHGTAGNGQGPRDAVVRARRILEPVQAALTEAGFYAYGTIDDQNRWTVAADDEAGRIDVRVEDRGFVLSLWTSSPGLYADVENPWRRRRMEGAAQRAIARVARGFLESHQAATWDEVDQGVAVSERFLVPFARARELGRIVQTQLPRLLELLEDIERRVAD
jgi:hypothetical protein